MTHAFTGIYTALVTPFKNGKVDEKAFQELVEWQVNEGVHGLVPCGTTGESPTLSYEEHQRVIALTVEVAKGRAKVMAGTGANATEEAVMFTRHAEKVGADGALIVTPYYNKPTPEGVFQHFKAIHDATNLPIVVYNIPGRSVINLSDDTLARLATLPRVVGLKDATGDLSRPYTLRHTLSSSPHRGEVGRGAVSTVERESPLPNPPPARGREFVQLSGEDMTAVAFNAAGGKGCISVLSNVVPKACAAVQEACLRGDFTQAAALHEPLVPLASALFCETSPAPVKYALSLLGKCAPDLRLPLVLPSAENQKRIREVLVNLRLL